MLYLYQSNRLEDLAALFNQVHRLQPPADPLAEEEIVVQSQGMRRYLNAYLARETGVAANLRFSLPAGLAWRLMRELIPGIPALSPFSPEVMRWRLLGLFQSRLFQTASEYQSARDALQSYLGSGGSAAYQLAGQLADIFDQYLVYRPQWIDAWQQGKTLGLGSGENWQAALWRYLDDGSTQTPHRVALWRQLLGALDKSKLPERYCVFGIATMAPMYLQLLQALAEHCDVHIFALNPSSAYWGNVIEAAQVLQQEGDIDLSQAGHPLLASLGKQGRDFFDALAEVPKHEIPVFDDEPFQTAPPTLLRCLQHDIQTLTMPSESCYTADGVENDRSIQIVSAHSPLRELQILKNRLLAVLAEHPEWQPHDIAVLTPNIEPYSPFIEAVFGQEQAGAQALPYSVSDVKISRRQPLFQALSQTLALLESRFEVDLLLPLLENDLVLQRFELSRDDLPLLHDTIAALNVHWGLDNGMRGSSDNLFTWQQGLERLALGWLLPENGNPLWHNISAWHGNPGQTAVLGRFTALVRTLAAAAREWQRPATVAEWAERVRNLLTALTAPGSGDQYAWQQLSQSLARWQQEAALAGFESPLPQHTVIRHIGRFLDSESQAGFLRGGITFCSMVPMRSLPFKVICLLGLNDGDFPRNTKAAAFDLIARHPQKGDRARRDDDRYLFLEAIMSAREILYLSYVGRDIRNNQELAPSALLNELADTLAAMTGRSTRSWHENHIEHHPLQPFSRSYFTGQPRSDGLQSTRRDYAAALNAPATAPAPFFSEPPGEAGNTVQAVSHHEFIRFWKNPVKSWLQHTLNWRAPYRDTAWDAAEPFEPQQAAAIVAEYTAARRSNENFQQTEARLQAESLLPAGELGILWQRKFQAAAKSLDGTLVASPKLPALPYTLELDGTTLSGSLNHLYQHGQIYFLSEKPHSPAHIAILLEHLIFCAVRPSETPNRQTHLLLPAQPETLLEIPQPEALELLRQWLDYYRLGQTRPLPFFARTTLKAAEELAQNKSREEAEKAARGVYYGNQNSKGQRDYTEVALVFGNDETPPIETPLFWNMAEQLLAPLLKYSNHKSAE